MTKRERTLAVLSGKQPDKTPTSFSFHFPQAEKTGSAGIAAHLRFFAETDVDIIKIMNEHQVPSIPNITRASDWKQVPTYKRTDDFIQNEADFVKQILDGYPQESLSLCTIHGACASMVHPMRPQYQDLYYIRAVQLSHYRENPQLFLDAARRIADAQCMMVEEVLKAGADGIYYAALGGESDIYTDEEFETVLKPFDLQIMDACHSAGKTVVLHMCKKRLDINRYVEYGPHCDCVNWGVYENNISLTEGASLFPGKTIMGGLANRSGVLIEGTEQQLREEIHAVKNEMANHQFILGADCTLPTDIPLSRIRLAVDIAHGL